MKKIGYARVSTKDQNLDLQIDALTAANCDLIFEETESGKKAERPELAKALAVLNAGDTLVVYKLDRLTRSLQHLLEVSQILKDKKANLQSTTNDIDTSNPMGKAFFQIIGVIAELEREVIVERTLAGLKAARNSGAKFGPKQKTDPKTIRALVASGMAKAEIGKQLNCSRATIYRALNEEAA
jgi:DNA invertase Pin-like site-specific DNA recombinase